MPSASERRRTASDCGGQPVANCRSKSHANCWYSKVTINPTGLPSFAEGGPLSSTEATNHMGGIRRTAEGIELTHRTVQATVGLLALVVISVAFGLRKNEKIDGAVQKKEFADTTSALRRDMATIALSAERAALSAEAAGKQSNKVLCYLAKYPLGLCDEARQSSTRSTP